jgi:tetratricopeptide (TPR) repeat protein
LAGVLCLAPARSPAQAVAPSSQAPQKNWKDRTEYDLFDAITKDTNPKTRLDKLLQWEKQYPQTDYVKERQQLLLTTYAALNQPKEAVEAAKKILADDPKNFSALYYTMFFTRPLYSATQQVDVLDQGEKATKAVLTNIETPPANITAEQWKSLRPQVENLAHVTLGFGALQKKDWETAELEFKKSLQMDANNSDVDYMLGTAIASQKNVAKYPTALFYLARAAAYDGPGSTSAEGRRDVLAAVQKMYKGYHGSDQGLPELLALAKSHASPPPDFKIESAKDIAEREAQLEMEKARQNPELALWKNIKAALTGPDGPNYFNSSMKDAQLPTLKGKVVKLEPENKPKTIILALEDGTTGDATLKFEMALPGKVEAGTELSFEGVPESYTASPFMVVFNVEPDHLHGWTGKNAPAAPHRRPAATKGKAGTKK